MNTREGVIPQFQEVHPAFNEANVLMQDGWADEQSQVIEGRTVTQIVINRNGYGIALIAGTNLILRTENFGQSWSYSAALQNAGAANPTYAYDPASIQEMPPSDTNEFVIGAGDKLYKTLNGGLTVSASAVSLSNETSNSTIVGIFPCDVAGYVGGYTVLAYTEGVSLMSMYLVNNAMTGALTKRQYTLIPIGRKLRGFGYMNGQFLVGIEPAMTNGSTLINIPTTGAHGVFNNGRTVVFASVIYHIDGYYYGLTQTGALYQTQTPTVGASWQVVAQIPNNGSQWLSLGFYLGTWFFGSSVGLYKSTDLIDFEKVSDLPLISSIIGVNNRLIFGGEGAINYTPFVTDSTLLTITPLYPNESLGEIKARSYDIGDGYTTDISRIVKRLFKNDSRLIERVTNPPNNFQGFYSTDQGKGFESWGDGSSVRLIGAIELLFDLPSTTNFDNGPVFVHTDDSSLYGWGLVVAASNSQVNVRMYQYDQVFSIAGGGGTTVHLVLNLRQVGSDYYIEPYVNGISQGSHAVGAIEDFNAYVYLACAPSDGVSTDGIIRLVRDYSDELTGIEVAQIYDNMLKGNFALADYKKCASEFLPENLETSGWYSSRDNGKPSIMLSFEATGSITLTEKLPSFLSDYPPSIGMSVLDDFNLKASYNIKGVYVDTSDTLAVFTALNAVVQPPQSPDLTEPMLRFLQDRLVQYPGYPLMVTVLNNSRQSAQVIAHAKDGRSVAVYLTYPTRHAVISLDENVEWESVTLSNSLASTTLTIKPSCPHEEGILIRWINTKAGYEQYMFGPRYFVENKTDKIVSVQRSYESDTERRQAMVSAQNRSEITIGAEGISKDEYDYLSGVIISPKIDVFDPVNKVWHGMVLADSVTLEWDTRNSLGDVEFTLAMPPRLMQY